MHLHVRAYVPGLEERALDEIISMADENCPVSNLLRNGLEIKIEFELLESAPAS